jgi:hypothetical protein
MSALKDVNKEHLAQMWEAISQEIANVEEGRGGQVIDTMSYVDMIISRVISKRESTMDGAPWAEAFSCQEALLAWLIMAIQESSAARSQSVRLVNAITSAARSTPGGSTLVLVVNPDGSLEPAPEVVAG